jgi:transcriptional regulator with XRE-family HTH domain
MDIGSTIQQYRKARGRGRIAFARKLGITPEGLRLIERNRRVPTAPTLERIITEGRIPQDVADKLREIAMNSRVLRTGFDPDIFVDHAWTSFLDFLTDEGLTADVDLDYLRDGFSESLRKHLPGWRP